MNLRDYQIEALEIIDRDLMAEPNVLLQAVMGAGKTVIAARLVNRYWFTTDRKFLVLAHKQELVEQFEQTFREMSDIPAYGISVMCAGLNRREAWSRVTLATIQTFINQVDDYPGADLCIIDEVHNVNIDDSDAQYSTVIRALRSKINNMRILGLSATPFRLGWGFCYGDKCKPGGKNLFPRLNHRITYDRLRKAGHLVELRGMVAHADQLTADLAEVKVNGDYVLGELGDVMSREIHLQTAVDAIKEYCGPYKRVCVFCCTIDHAEKLKALISEIEPCVTVHSGLSQIERMANMEDWKSGRVRIVTSVNILSEGYNFSKLDCLVFARPTISPRLFLQAVGRVLRTHPGKEFGYLLDLTDNTARFGTDLDAVRVVIPRAVIKDYEAKNELWKLCPGCMAECHKSLRVCMECGFVFPVSEVVEAASVPEMAEVKFEKKPPIEVEVVDMEADVHQAKSGNKFLGRVKLYYHDGIYRGEKFVSVWFCFSDFYSGYAVMKGQERWAEMCDEPYPETIEEFMELREHLIQPSRIALDVSGKYPEIAMMYFDGIPEKQTELQENEDDEDLPF